MAYLQWNLKDVLSGYSRFELQWLNARTYFREWTRIRDMLITHGNAITFCAFTFASFPAVYWHCSNFVLPTNSTIVGQEPIVYMCIMAIASPPSHVYNGANIVRSSGISRERKCHAFWRWLDSISLLQNQKRILSHPRYIRVSRKSARRSIFDRIFIQRYSYLNRKIDRYF